MENINRPLGQGRGRGLGRGLRKEANGGVCPRLQGLTKKEIIDRDYNQKRREQRIGLMRSNVVRNQIIEAYEILENIRFDYLGDTAFREKIVNAKRGLERALEDFLLDETYHRKNIKRMNDISPEEYMKELEIESELPTQSN